MSKHITMKEGLERIKNYCASLPDCHKCEIGRVFCDTIPVDWTDQDMDAILEFVKEKEEAGNE